ncbi:MAG: hypothetical protein M1834_004905 [Cirrosporium novae-zelandiae]|nr:MAG: hypothetical protein M1834_004905 [Cirrosporium novae-zelandiae]
MFVGPLWAAPLPTYGLQRYEVQNIWSSERLVFFLDARGVAIPSSASSIGSLIKRSIYDQEYFPSPESQPSTSALEIYLTDRNISFPLPEKEVLVDAVLAHSNDSIKVSHQPFSVLPVLTFDQLYYFCNSLRGLDIPYTVTGSYVGRPVKPLTKHRALATAGKWDVESWLVLSSDSTSAQETFNKQIAQTLGQQPADDYDHVHHHDADFTFILEQFGIDGHHISASHRASLALNTTDFFAKGTQSKFATALLGDTEINAFISKKKEARRMADTRRVGKC